MLGFGKKKKAVSIENIVPEIDFPFDPQSINDYTLEQTRLIIRDFSEYVKTISQNAEQFKQEYVMVKSNINSLMNKSEESQQKIAMLKEDLKDSMINLEKYEVDQESKTTLGIYLKHLLSQIYQNQQYSSLSDCFEKLKVMVRPSLVSIKQFEARLKSTLDSLEGGSSAQAEEEFQNLLETIEEIDDTTMSNIEVVNEALNYVSDKLDNLGTFLQKRFGDTEVDMGQRKSITIAMNRFEQISAENKQLKISLKELDISLKTSEKQLQTYSDRNVDLEEVIGTLKVQVEAMKQNSVKMNSRGQDNSQEIESLRMALDSYKQSLPELQTELQRKTMLVEQQQTSLTKISEQIDTLKKRQKAKLAELETQLKQEKLAHDQSRKDVKNLKARNKENDDYLKKEAVKRNEIQRKLSTLQKKYEELNEKYSLKTKQLEELKEENKSMKDNQSSGDLDHRNVGSLNNLNNEVGDGGDDQNTHPQSLEDMASSFIKQQANLAEGGPNYNTLLKENREMKIKIDQVDILLEKKEIELEEAKKIIEDKTDLLQETQDKVVMLKKEHKIISEKRKNGLDEIRKLRDRLDDMRMNYSVNQSLNTSFSIDAVNNNDISIMMEPTQIQSLLEIIYKDLQTLYKEAVMLLPLKDIIKNNNLIKIERRINGIINLVCENLE